jgi:hypothetical protein
VCCKALREDLGPYLPRVELLVRRERDVEGRRMREERGEEDERWRMINEGGINNLIAIIAIALTTVAIDITMVSLPIHQLL